MIYARKHADADGAYTAADGTRWNVSFVRNVRPTTGWTQFDNTTAALTAWGLTYAPLPAPQEEEEEAADVAAVESAITATPPAA